MNRKPINSEAIMARLVESTRGEAYNYIFSSVQQAAQSTVSEDTQALIIGAAKLLGLEGDIAENLVVHSAPSPSEDVEAEANVQSARLARSLVSTWFEHILMAAESGHQDIVLDKHFCLTGAHRTEFYEDLLLAGSRYELEASGTIAILAAGCSTFLAGAHQVALPDGLYLRRVGGTYSVLTEERLSSFENYLEHLDIAKKFRELVPAIKDVLAPAVAHRATAAKLVYADFESSSVQEENDQLLSACTYVLAQDRLIHGVSALTDNRLESQVMEAMVSCVKTPDAISVSDTAAIHVAVHAGNHEISS